MPMVRRRRRPETRNPERGSATTCGVTVGAERWLLANRRLLRDETTYWDADRRRRSFVDYLLLA
ncbi:hypothetical protein U1Q18_046618 [Sarracenia purpurea var. burkii]